MSKLISVVQPVLSSATRTTSGVSNGIRGGFQSGIFLISITAASGTGKKLVCKAQVSDDNSTWYDVNATPVEYTIVGNFSFPMSYVGKYFRLNYSISGTSPSFTFSAKFEGKAY